MTLQKHVFSFSSLLREQNLDDHFLECVVVMKTLGIHSVPCWKDLCKQLVRQNGQRTRVKNYKMFWNNTNSLTTTTKNHIVMTFVATYAT